MHALTQLKSIGFKYYEGDLTKNLKSQGYRSANPEDRAKEFMDLIKNPDVKCVMSTIGGWNSSSMIQYLDFDEIRKSRKIICGYSDITSLQLAILKYSGLSTIYGPSLIPTFGEYPTIQNYSLESFLNVATNRRLAEHTLHPPSKYSRQFINAIPDDWQKKESEREYQQNEGWRVLSEGFASGEMIVANLETLLALAGTTTFPDLKDKILILEDEGSKFGLQERGFTQLLQIGAFDNICGLIVSKPFSLNSEEAPFSYDDLIIEIVGKRSYPIISNFDCGHTIPSISLPIGAKAMVEAFDTKITFIINKITI